MLRTQQANEKVYAQLSKTAQDVCLIYLLHSDIQGERERKRSSTKNEIQASQQILEGIIKRL